VFEALLGGFLTFCSSRSISGHGESWEEGGANWILEGLDAASPCPEHPDAESLSFAPALCPDDERGDVDEVWMWLRPQPDRRLGSGLACSLVLHAAVFVIAFLACRAGALNATGEILYMTVQLYPTEEGMGDPGDGLDGEGGRVHGAAGLQDEQPPHAAVVPRVAQPLPKDSPEPLVRPSRATSVQPVRNESERIRAAKPQPNPVKRSVRRFTAETSRRERNPGPAEEGSAEPAAELHQGNSAAESGALAGAEQVTGGSGTAGGGTGGPNGTGSANGLAPGGRGGDPAGREAVLRITGPW
jgi:hypothetical protein